jgi:hypothetical protein
MSLWKNGPIVEYVSVQNDQSQELWSAGLLLERLNDKKVRRRKTKNDKDNEYMCWSPGIEDLPAHKFHKKYLHSSELAVTETTSDQCHSVEKKSIKTDHIQGHVWH